MIDEREREREREREYLEIEAVVKKICKIAQCAETNVLCRKHFINLS